MEEKVKTLFKRARWSSMAFFFSSPLPQNWPIAEQCGMLFCKKLTNKKNTVPLPPSVFIFYLNEWMDGWNSSNIIFSVLDRSHNGRLCFAWTRNRGRGVRGNGWKLFRHVYTHKQNSRIPDARIAADGGGKEGEIVQHHKVIKEHLRRKPSFAK